MDTTRQELRIGVMVLAAIASLILMSVFFGKQSVVQFGNAYPVQVRFQRIPGIKRGSPVTKNGVQIGRVSNFELVDNDREVEITLLLDKRRRIYTNEECRIKQTMIMGDTSLEFVKRTNYTGKIEEIDPAIPLVGSGSNDIMSGFSNIEGDLSKAIQSVSDAAENLGQFIERINAVLGSTEEFQERRVRVEAFFNEARDSMTSFRQVSEGMRQYVNDPQIRQDVKKITNEMPVILEQGRGLISESTSFVKDAKGMLERGNASLERLSKLADSLGDDAPEIVDSIKNTVAKMSSFFEELTMVISNMRNSDGTVKRLMNDPAVYEKILATVDHVEKLTAEADNLLKTDVRQITGNAKVLTDKAARDPSIFIRNLLRKEPPVKDLPHWVDDGDGDVYYEDEYVSVAPKQQCRLFPFLNFRRLVPVRTIPAKCDAVPVHDSFPADGEIIIDDEMMIERQSRAPRNGLPKNSPGKLQNTAWNDEQNAGLNDVIPPEGRIVNVDPRYPKDIRQASY